MARTLATPDLVRGRDRAAALFLLALMAVGSVALWIGIPAGCLWTASKFTESGAYHFLLALPLTITAMALFAPVLVWMNRLYVRVVYESWVEEDVEEEQVRALRGPLEPLLVGSLLLAIFTMMIWFFVFAQDPPSCAGN